MQDHMKKDLNMRLYRPTFVNELSDGDMDSSESDQFMVAYWSMYGDFSATLYIDLAAHTPLPNVTKRSRN
jgi:hypothetical protein